MTRPRILWIPHGAWHTLGGQRQQHLAARLASHFELHVISWRQPKTFVGLGASRRYEWGVPAVHVHEVTLAPNVYRLAGRRYPPQWAVAPNQVLFARHVRAVAAQGFAAGICSSSHHFTGYPPLVQGFPWLFDYVDLSPPAVERHYCAAAAGVLAVSPTLAERARRYGRPVALIPNGVDPAPYRSADGLGVRAAIGAGEASVVSLIGLTCSPSLYFVDALAAVARTRRVFLLAVGEGETRRQIARRAQALGVPCATPGWVEPGAIHPYFAATDIGLYPGDDSPYFRSASPLKVLEYLAAGRPVVSSPVDAWSDLGLTGVTTASATAEGFAGAIRGVLEGRGPRPGGVEALTWDGLATRLTEVLARLVAAPSPAGRRSDPVPS